MNEAPVFCPKRKGACVTEMNRHLLAFPLKYFKEQTQFFGGSILTDFEEKVMVDGLFAI